ncbi:mycothiol synthase [Nocardia stercoris]|uniref:Mycothiol acetyltransferase n=1 Tax=Nocardia stercoris TaxID=2483361 RepID=A0A3M2KYM2_9NOCA|nr:mycothiol synthase [Nocardia stercoris]RMI29726.1 mycothiol synthase [Nocardia stercoris]
MQSQSGTAWLTEVSADTAAQLRSLFERATETDSVAPISEQAVLSLNGGTHARHLIATDAGRIVGYANLAPGHGPHPAMAEVVVDPPSRGRGIGNGLVAAALAAGGSDARVWAHGNLPAARAVAGRLGLTVARELWQMRVNLAESGLPELPARSDVVLRTYAGPEDDAELLRVNAAAFDWHPEQGVWTEADVAARRESEWFDPAGLIIATDAADPARVLGFHWTKIEPAAPGEGEVYVVAVDPAAQGRGLGRLLTVAGMAHMRARGADRILLYTEADNTAAVHTYSRLGFAVAHVDAAYHRP